MVKTGLNDDSIPPATCVDTFNHCCRPATTTIVQQPMKYGDCDGRLFREIDTDTLLDMDVKNNRLLDYTIVDR